MFTLSKTFAYLSSVVEGYFWYFVGLASCIVYLPCLVDIVIIFMMSRWLQSFCVNYNIFWADLTRFYIYFYQAQICTNDKMYPNYVSTKGENFVFPFSFARTKYELEHPWGLSSRYYFLGVLLYNFRSFALLDALLYVNSVMRLPQYSCYYRYRGF